MTTARRRFVPVVALAATAAFGPLLPASAHAASPLDTGCPAAYETLSVAWLSTQGPYMVPGVLDAAGNGDGLVCGKAVSAAATAVQCGNPCAVPVFYNFSDNTRTPRH